MQDLRKKIHTAGMWSQDIQNTFRELKSAIRSMDRERIANSKSAIRQLRKAVHSIITGSTKDLRKLGLTIQDLQNAVDSIKNTHIVEMSDLKGIFCSKAEWWRDLTEALGSVGEISIMKKIVRMRNVDMLTVDKPAEVIAGLGVPALVLIIAMAYSPWVGAAAITASLAALGPFGMLGGIATLGVLGFISRALAKFGFDKVFQAVLVKMKKDGETSEGILGKIEGYPISKELKRKLREFIEKFCEGENDEQ